MPRKRVKAKDRQFQITPEAVAAFKAWRAAETDDESEAHYASLHSALSAKPWEFRCVASPHELPPDDPFRRALFKKARDMWDALSEAAERLAA